MRIHLLYTSHPWKAFHGKIQLLIRPYTATCPADDLNEYFWGNEV